MDFLQLLDAGLFRFINLKLANPFFDWLMPALSWHWLFPPLLLAIAAWLNCKGGRRGRLCVLLVVLVVALGDGLVINKLKKVHERPRPFAALPDARVIVGKSASFSMPSGHTANWFGAAMVAFIFYRRRAAWLFAMAAAVGFSRIYNGVHYPGDVLAGAILGSGYAALAVWLANEAWRKIGMRWFPLWWEQMPSVFNPDATLASNTAAGPHSAFSTPHSAFESHWFRLGCMLIAALFVARLAYLAAGRIELSEDEAYQWMWSKHLDLAYYSKPPGIALAQRLGCALWGDNEFGVRFLSPCIAALLGVLLLRFMAREADARTGVLLLVAVATTPLLAVGATLMTIDALSVLFWTATMLAGWRALRDGSTRDWLWTGVWLGCGFLCKATALFQLVSFALVFLLIPKARLHLRKPGPWLALGFLALSTLPVLVWNARHGWATAQHLQSRAGLEGAWKPTLSFLQDFVLAELALLNPVFFVLMAVAIVGFVSALLCSGRNEAALAHAEHSKPETLLRYLFCMGAPLFAGYLLWTLRARVQPNWIAPAVLPLLMFALLWWRGRWLAGARGVGRWFAGGAAVGLFAVVVLHETNLVPKLTGAALPAGRDPLARVRGWRSLAAAVDVERQKLAAEGKPVFLIGAHYGITSLLNFYTPGARPLAAKGELRAFYPTAAQPENQYFFWSGYRGRHTGASAIFVLPLKGNAPPQPPPERIVREFASVTDLGIVRSEHRGVVVHTAQLFACRDLKP
jgi:4-amino-4-deoxy-L-arabinose transferase-like glycosyltransferase